MSFRPLPGFCVSQLCAEHMPMNIENSFRPLPGFCVSQLNHVYQMSKK